MCGFPNPAPATIARLAARLPTCGAGSGCPSGCTNPIFRKCCKYAGS